MKIGFFLLRSEEYVILKKEEWMKERIDIF